jgi:hypothetical protein
MSLEALGSQTLISSRVDVDLTAIVQSSQIFVELSWNSLA